MPDFGVLETLGFGGSALVLALGVLALFWNGDNAISDELRSDLSDYLLRHRRVSDPGVWIVAVASVFDRIFGPRHLSFRRFFSSSVVSIAFGAIVFLMLALIENQSFRLVYLEDLTVFELIFVFLIFSFFCNVLCDYVSIIQTRIIITYMNMSNYIVLIFLDLVLSIVIFFSFSLIIIFIMTFVIDAGAIGNITFSVVVGEILRLFDPSQEIRKASLFGLQLPFVYFVLFPYFLTNLFTSVWVWLTGVSWAILRYANHLNALTRFLQYALPIRQYPVRAIGEIAAVVVLIVVGCLAAIGIEFGGSVAQTN